MAFNNWPYTNFQDLNLGWILAKVKEALSKATEALTGVNHYSEQIAQANTNASEALNTANAISATATEALNTANTASTNAENALTTANGFANDIDQANETSNRAELNAQTALQMADLISQNQAFSCIIDATTNPVTVSRPFDALYSLLATQKKPVNFIMVDAGGSVYQTSLAFIDDTQIKVVFILNRTSTSLPYPVIYATITNSGVTLATDSIISSASGGTAPYLIPVTVSGGVYSTTATGAEIFENRANCYAEINGVMYYPIGCSTSGPVGDVYLAAVDPHTVGSYDVDILQFHLTDANNIATVTRYSNDIDAGKTQKIMISASSSAIPPLSPNTLYVFTGDATALNIQLATPSDSNIANEYHFIFNSGATATTLTLPSNINQPDGFTVEANHVYEVSILEGNMLATGWAVSGT